MPLKSVEWIIDECHCEFARTVRAKINENNHIAILYARCVANNGWLDEFVILSPGVRLL